MKQLGFEDDDFLEHYIDELEKYASRLRYSNTENQIDNIIDLLFSEIRIKRKKKLDRKPPNDFISATDIATFTYCPVSYSIAKSFKIPKSESAVIGSQLHDRGNILSIVDINKKLDNEPSYREHYTRIDLSYLVDNENEFFFDKIKSSELVYADYRNNEKSKVFTGENGVFVGRPDYIFKDIDGKYFIVEEKYKYHSPYENEKKNFYDSHVKQVTSYIYGISEPRIDYGFLVYWKYGFHNHDVRLYECRVKEFVRTATNKQDTVKIFKDLQHFISKKQLRFDKSSRNPKKCANCVYNIYCGHKTGYFEKLTLPYQIGFLFTKNVPIPDELKKEDKHDSLPDIDNFPL